MREVRAEEAREELVPYVLVALEEGAARAPLPAVAVGGRRRALQLAVVAGVARARALGTAAQRTCSSPL